MLTNVLLTLLLAGNAPRLVADVGSQHRQSAQGGAVGGHLLLPMGKLWLDLGLHEGLDTGGSVGAIFIGLRGIGRGGFLRAGLAHHHNVGWATIETEPLGAFAGTADGIDHRTGFGLGGGWRGDLRNSTLLPTLMRQRSHWLIDLGIDGTYGDTGFDLLGTLRIGLELDFGSKAGRQG